LKSRIAISALAVALCAQAGLAAFAEPMMETTSSEPVTGGLLTRGGHPVWKVCSFPLRLTTGIGGMMIGAMVSGSKNVVKMEQEFARNTYGQAKESPALYPVGAIGSVVAVPVGFVTGMPEGAAVGARAGFQLWDRV
jgi:hypothetical protein